MDASKPIVKSVKILQSILNDSDGFIVDKLQKNLKSNKAEFLRLFFLFDDVSKIEKKEKQ